MKGIIACGAYVPPTRLLRSSAVEANSWLNPALRSLGKGERSFVNWDEDTITMAVEAGRDCLTDCERHTVGSIFLASTTAPFADRLNAGVIKEALLLEDGVCALDIGGSQRAGTSALIQAFQDHSEDGKTLCIASEVRKARPASDRELLNGDAAAGMLIGNGDALARLIGHHSLTIDFVDHFRPAGKDFDYFWEERWIRDKGLLEIVPKTASALLEKVGVTAEAVDRFIFPATNAKISAAVAKACGVKQEAVVDTLFDVMGNAGTAHPIFLLCKAIEEARAGEKLLVFGFGQGCDALLFERTDAPVTQGLGMGAGKWLERRIKEENYTKFLSLCGAITPERGMRAEIDQKTALTALYRNRKAVLGLVGGRCSKTGVVQFPKTEIGVEGGRDNTGTLEDYPLSEVQANVLTHTEDYLAYTPAPPFCYGMIEFSGGGRMTVEFADVDTAEIKVGTPVRMMFRIVSVDHARGFPKYFWKAVPEYRTA